MFIELTIILTYIYIYGRYILKNTRKYHFNA